MTGRKVRTKKLGVKTLLPILRESDIDPSEYEALITENLIATGVEQAEEKEYHLQSILRDAGTSNNQEIPVPPPRKNSIGFAKLYPPRWEEPKTYIRSSNTVEEYVLGSSYDMTAADGVFLTKRNSSLPSEKQLSEDDFEHIMEVYEEVSSEQVPSSPVDGNAVVVAPYELMVVFLGQLDSSVVAEHAEAVYEHWSDGSKALGNKPLRPTLKFETGLETDDTDPYVCFRRREARQTRKTRARDVQFGERLKRLRMELEDGHKLVELTGERENLKRRYMDAERAVFVSRKRLKQMKVQLGIRGEDEDLYNHKPPKRKAAEPTAAPRGSLYLRMPNTARPGIPSMDSELLSLEDYWAAKESKLRAYVEEKIRDRLEWNTNHIDQTESLFTPIGGLPAQPSYLPVGVRYPDSPPASEYMGLDDDSDGEQGNGDDEGGGVTAGRWNPLSFFSWDPTPVADESPLSIKYAYRRRTGRLGRLWIDKKILAWPNSSNWTKRDAERWKFDRDDDDDDGDDDDDDVDEPPVCEFDLPVEFEQEDLGDAQRPGTPARVRMPAPSQIQPDGRGSAAAREPAVVGAAAVLQANKAFLERAGANVHKSQHQNTQKRASVAQTA